MRLPVLQNTTVYNTSLEKRIPYDNEKAQKVLRNMISNVLQEYGEPDVHGQVVSNHPILTSPGALFGILCIEDDKEFFGRKALLIKIPLRILFYPYFLNRDCGQNL